MTAKEFGMIGLGRMGGNLSLQALSKGIRVVGYTRGDIGSDLIARGLVSISSLEEFKGALSRPRAIFLYIPAGSAVDVLIDQLMTVLDKGDVIVDGGNSYWGDSIERGKRLRERGILFVDLGTSGGVEGAKSGACFMAGGDDMAMDSISPLLTALSVPGGYLHTGPVGTGHFTKLVHNGIEFGMMQVIGEGIGLLAHYRQKLDIPAILECWEHGSVIRSWLIELLGQQYRELGGMDKVPSYVEDTGEVNWLVSDAIQMEMPIPAISLSIMELFTSRDKEDLRARAIAMMRHGFGGHPLGPDRLVARERQHGRVGCIYRKEEDELKCEI